MAFCRKCGHQLEDNVSFCPNCGEPTAAPAASEPVTQAPKEESGPLFWRIYGKAFKALMEKPFRLWGISLLGSLLIVIGGALAGFAIPAIAIAISMLFTVSLAAIFLKGYHREQVYCHELFETFKDWPTMKRVLAGMGWYIGRFYSGQLEEKVAQYSGELKIAMLVLGAAVVLYLIYKGRK